MSVRDLVIIGGGPAGITAGIYAARQKIDVLLVAKTFGGQIMRKAVEIENYPGFPRVSSLDLIQKLEEHLDRYKVPVEFEEVSELSKKDGCFSVKTKDGNEFFSRSVIIASGAVPRLLNVPGEKEFVGRGVSYCTACDGPIFNNKRVAVVGGGNAGFETAIFMTSYATKVYIIENGPVARADAFNQEKAASMEKIELITGAEIKEIAGDKMVKKIVYKDGKTGEAREIGVEGVFMEVGYQPASDFIKGDLVEFNEKMEIKVDFETFATKTPGLFAAGDINSGRHKQIIIASGQGAKAALEAYRYLQEREKENKI